MSAENLKTSLLVALVATVTSATGAHAADARAMALGGSVIANGKGAHGALANPAALMHNHRDGHRFALSFGANIEIRDDAGLIDIATDDANDSLESDIDDAVNDIDVSALECDPQTAEDETTCLSGLDALASLSSRALGIIDTIDNEVVAAQGEAGLGMAFYDFRFPYALHLQTRATGRGKLRASETDRAYFGNYQSTLDDGTLTFGEINDSAEFTINPNGGSVDVLRPEDVLTSEGNGGALTRVTFGASVATTVNIGTHAVDLGVTPKFSQLRAQGIDISLRDEFDSEAEALEDRFGDSEVSESSFTFDVGATLQLDEAPVRVAAVLRNVVPESIESESGFEFETTPQFIVGGVYQFSFGNVNADLAINEADVDSFPTQVFALGAEFHRGAFAVRTGINHDMARDAARTGFSLGLGLGPVEIAARTSGIEHMQAGLQLALSF